MNIKKIARQADRLRRQVQNVATLGASDAIGGALGRAGVPTNLRDATRRVIGKRNMGQLYGRPGVTRPMAVDVDHGLPAGLAGAKCVAVNPKDGSTNRPYNLLSRIQLAASAQAIDTSLGDFFAAAAIDDVSTDNIIPFGFKCRQAMAVIGLNELIASPVANPAMLAGFYLKWLINNREEARWPLLKFAKLITNNGLVTSGGGAMAHQFVYDPVPFVVDFDPDSKYALQLFNTKAVTPAAVVDLTMIFEGSL